MPELLVKIVTLKEVCLDEEAAMATLPAWDGEVGIMPMHIPFIFKLREGTVKLYKEDGSIKKEVQVQGGFASIYEDSISIVTNSVI